MWKQELKNKNKTYFHVIVAAQEVISQSSNLTPDVL